MKVAIITVNMGYMDKEPELMEQSIPIDFYRFNDANFPPRICSMTSRLQARIPKCFGWQMVPGYDYYIWIDSSFAIRNKDTAKYYVEQCKGYDMAFFKHPKRESVKEEVEFIKEKLGQRNYYLEPRYKNELGDELVAEMYADKTFKDNTLIADAAFVYKNNEKVHALMKEWWYWISRYHSNDQLGLPYAIHKSDCKVKIINQHYLYTPYITYTRGAWRK